MERNLKEALKHRRSYYAIDNQTTIPDAEIEEILDFAALHTPSAFNSQSTRMVLLLREQHRRLWDIVRNTLKKTIPAAAYASTEAKINKSFAAGYGTVLFFEDTDKEVIATWKLPATWELIAQMPFGLPLEPPQKKEYKPLCDRVRVFK